MDENEYIFIPTMILNFILILITFYLLFLYLKTEEFYDYSWIYIFNLSLSISIDNIVRIMLIPKEWSEILIFQYFQAFLLVFFDKFILLILTMQIFIIYIGIMKTNFYYEHEKTIFLSTFCGSLLLCLIFGLIYSYSGLIKYGIYYYAEDTHLKHILDIVFNSIFLFLNTFFSIVNIINIIIKIKSIKASMKENDAHNYNLGRIILMLILSSLLYIESFLILFDKFPISDDLIDFIYLITCFLIDVFYVFNQKVLFESKKLFCKRFFKQKKQRMISTFQNSYKTSTKNSSSDMESYI
jgi:hypothetical protein